MIVPMKKVSIVVMDKDKDAALERLRELGIVHLERKTVASSALNGLMDRKAQIEAAESALQAFAPKKGTAAPGSFKGDLADHATRLAVRRKTLQDEIFNAERERQRFEKWGDFAPEDFAFLAENGVNAYLYDVSLETYANVGDVPVIPLSINKKGKSARFVAFDKIPGEQPAPLPEKSITGFDAEIGEKKAEIAKIEAELASLSSLGDVLKREKNAVMADAEFEMARAGMEAAETNGGAELSVSWLAGYVPAPETGVLKRAAAENGWAFCADDPADDDGEVPTKLKNSKLVSFVYPLVEFLDLSPGYREADISGWFLLFFTLFFGMIFGDAGYGAVLLTISLVGIGKTAKKGVPLIFGFLLLMSCSNFLWGLLSGSWFGFDISLVPQFLQNLSLPLIANVSESAGWLDSYNAGNLWIQTGLVTAQTSVAAQEAEASKNLMLFCFSIALAQLGVAHIKGIISNIKSPKVFAEIGQLAMIVGMYFVVLSLVVYNTGFGGLQRWQYGTLLGGFILSFVFGNYEGSILKSVIASFANIITVVLGVANVFSDIMSYIRLWAVGLAGAQIASTIDGFAGPMLGHFIFFIFGIALLVFGHGFNMVLNVLSVIVHGVRLNTLEFSSHLGLTWSGFAYKPFAKR
jgi:V/A-type H+-transporting ATPase subunit I